MKKIFLLVGFCGGLFSGLVASDTAPEALILYSTKEQCLAIVRDVINKSTTLADIKRLSYETIANDWGQAFYAAMTSNPLLKELIPSASPSDELLYFVFRWIYGLAAVPDYVKIIIVRVVDRLIKTQGFIDGYFKLEETDIELIESMIFASREVCFCCKRTVLDRGTALRGGDSFEYDDEYMVFYACCGGCKKARCHENDLGCRRLAKLEVDEAHL